MVIMALDHVRDYTNLGYLFVDPTNLDTTTPLLFFTRWITHFCAPVFVFLTGVSAWLYAHPTNKQDRPVQGFLLKRGLFIIFIELTLINFSWFGDYNALYLQVMWAIGLSMVTLAFITKLPHWLIGCIGFAIVFGHNSLAFISFQPNEFGYTFWTILHDRGFIYVSDTFKVKASYPVLPWIGVILLGYFIAPIFSGSTSAKKRKKILINIGVACIAILLILRGFNIYGETLPWVLSENGVTSIKSFINYSKYPPSLDFLLFTLSISLIVLAALEGVNNRFTKVIEYFGSAPMFFYIVHLYVLLVSYRILVITFGTTKGDYWGLDAIWQVWAVASLLAILLYWPTKAFSRFKQKTRSPWIKYL